MHVWAWTLLWTSAASVAHAQTTCPATITITEYSGLSSLTHLSTSSLFPSSRRSIVSSTTETSESFPEPSSSSSSLVSIIPSGSDASNGSPKASTSSLSSSPVFIIPSITHAPITVTVATTLVETSGITSESDTGATGISSAEPSNPQSTTTRTVIVKSTTSPFAESGRSASSVTSVSQSRSDTLSTSSSNTSQVVARGEATNSEIAVLLAACPDAARITITLFQPSVPQSSSYHISSSSTEKGTLSKSSQSRTTRSSMISAVELNSDSEINATPVAHSSSGITLEFNSSPTSAVESGLQLTFGPAETSDGQNNNGFGIFAGSTTAQPGIALPSPVSASTTSQKVFNFTGASTSSESFGFANSTFPGGGFVTSFCFDACGGTLASKSTFHVNATTFDPRLTATPAFMTEPVTIDIPDGFSVCRSRKPYTDPNSKCGNENSFQCAKRVCCGSDNTCGKDEKHCGKGCQQGWGDCWKNTSSTCVVPFAFAHHGGHHHLLVILPFWFNWWNLSILHLHWFSICNRVTRWICHHILRDTCCRNGIRIPKCTAPHCFPPEDGPFSHDGNGQECEPGLIDCDDPLPPPENCTSTTATAYTYSCYARNASIVSGQIITAMTSCTKTASRIISGCSVSASTTSVIGPSCPIDADVSPDDEQGEDGADQTCPYLGDDTPNVDDDQGEDGDDSCLNVDKGDETPDADQGPDNADMCWITAGNLTDPMDDQGLDNACAEMGDITATQIVESCYRINVTASDQPQNATQITFLGSLKTSDTTTISCTTNSTLIITGTCVQPATVLDIGACPLRANITIRTFGMPNNFGGMTGGGFAGVIGSKTEKSSKKSSSKTSTSDDAFHIPAGFGLATSILGFLYGKGNKGVCASQCTAPPLGAGISCVLDDVRGDDGLPTSSCNCGTKTGVLTPVVATVCGWKVCPAQTGWCAPVTAGPFVPPVVAEIGLCTMYRPLKDVYDTKRGSTVPVFEHPFCSCMPPGNDHGILTKLPKTIPTAIFEGTTICPNHVAEVVGTDTNWYAGQPGALATASCAFSTPANPDYSVCSAQYNDRYLTSCNCQLTGQGGKSTTIAPSAVCGSLVCPNQVSWPDTTLCGKDWRPDTISPSMGGCVTSTRTEVNRGPVVVCNCATGLGPFATVECGYSHCPEQLWPWESGYNANFEATGTALYVSAMTTSGPSISTDPLTLAPAQLVTYIAPSTSMASDTHKTCVVYSGGCMPSDMLASIAKNSGPSASKKSTQAAAAGNLIASLAAQIASKESTDPLTLVSSQLVTYIAPSISMAQDTHMTCVRYSGGCMPPDMLSSISASEAAASRKSTQAAAAGGLIAALAAAAGSQSKRHLHAGEEQRVMLTVHARPGPIPDSALPEDTSTPVVLLGHGAEYQ